MKFQEEKISLRGMTESYHDACLPVGANFVQNYSFWSSLSVALSAVIDCGEIVSCESFYGRLDRGHVDFFVILCSSLIKDSRNPGLRTLLRSRGS